MADFAASNLPVVLEKADRLWADNIARAQYVAKVDAWQHLQRVNTASIDTTLQGKDKTVRIAWINACDLAAVTCDTACLTDGTALDSDTEDYALSTCKEVPFKINYNHYRDNLFGAEEAIAKGLMKAMKELDEKIVQDYITFLNANGGTNEWTGWGSANAGNTEVPATDWTTAAFFKLMYTAQQNRFADATLLTGYNLAETIYNARANSGNADGKGDLVMTTGIASYLDAFNVETVNGATTYKSYLVDTGAVAFASKTYNNQRAAMWAGNRARFTRPSQNLPGVVYDVETYQTCVNREDIEVWSVSLKYDYFLNPTGCTATRTGILEFLNTNAM